MQRRVKCLVDRLSVPHVALRLRKEEVCLAMGALARVGSPTAVDTDGAVVAVEATMLRQRMLQFIPSCSAAELGMVAGGGMALQWCDGALSDQLTARAMAVGSAATSKGVAPFTFEAAGPLLLAAASIAWRDRSVAAEHCAFYLAREFLAAPKAFVVSDADQLAASVLGSTVFAIDLHTRPVVGAASSASSSVGLSKEELESLLGMLGNHCHRLTDVGVGLALSASMLVLANYPDASSKVLPLMSSFIRHIVGLHSSNLHSVAPSLLALSALAVTKSDGEARKLLVKHLNHSLELMELQKTTGDAQGPSFKTNETLLSLAYFSKTILSSIADAVDDFELACKFSLISDSAPIVSLPPLGVALVDGSYSTLRGSNSATVCGMLDYIDQMGRFTRDSTDLLGDAMRASKAGGTTVHRLRDAALTLLLAPCGGLSPDQLAAAISMSRLSNMRDPVALQSLSGHVQDVIDKGEVGAAKKVLAAFGSDVSVAGLLGISEVTRSALVANSQAPGEGPSSAGDMATMPLPLQFKALRARGEAVSDALLMSVLEAIDDWSAGDISYFVAAAPDKCVEFDMLIEKLSTGLEELNAEQLGCVLEAVAESPALALMLHDAALAQTAEVVITVGLDAPPLIAALIRLFVNTYASPTPDASVLQQREELRNLIDQAVGNVLSALSAADVMTTCGVLKAFKLCPTLGSMAAEVCCGHLLSFVLRGSSKCSFDELIEILWAMAAVDTVHADLIDAMVPQLDTILRAEGTVPSHLLTRFLDACVALDTPELDTLFQLCLGDCVTSTGNVEGSKRVVTSVEPAQLPSALSAALSLQHRQSVGHVLTQLSVVVGELRGSAQIINAIVNTIGGSSIASKSIVPLLCCSSAPVKSEDMSYLARQLLECASSLIGEERGHEVALGALFTSIERLCMISGYILEAELKKSPADDARMGSAVPMVPQSVMDCIVDRIDSLGGAEVATIIRALPHFDLEQNDTAIMLQILMTRLSHECDKCPPRLLSDAIFSLGELGGRIGSHITHHVAVDKMSDYCVDTVNNWTSGHGVCRLLYGFSRIACNKRSLFNVFGTQLGKRPLLKLLTREDISLAMSAFGNAKYLDKELYDAMAEHMVSIADDLNPADLTLVLSGYSRLNLLNQSLYDRLGERVATIAGQIPSGAAAKILCAYGHVGNSHDTMAEKLLTHVSENTAQIDANTCANTLYAIAQMNYSADTDHLDALAERIASDSESLTCESIDKVCEVMQELNWRNEALLRTIADRSVTLLQTGEEMMGQIKPPTARVVLDTLSFFMVHHTEARRCLSDAARTISRDPSVVAALSANSGGSGDAARIEE